MQTPERQRDDRENQREHQQIKHQRQHILVMLRRGIYRIVEHGAQDGYVQVRPPEFASRRTAGKHEILAVHACDRLWERAAVAGQL